jgi:hypothetical protein
MKIKFPCDWIGKVWVNILKYMPSYHILSQGWLAYVFRSGVDVENF